MEDKLFDSEAKVMEILWDHGELPAREINKNTTYTVIKKLEAKGFLRRDEPGFLCTALITREEARRTEARTLLHKVFGGSRKALFSALLEGETLSDDEIDQLRRLIDGR